MFQVIGATNALLGIIASFATETFLRALGCLPPFTGPELHNAEHLGHQGVYTAILLFALLADKDPLVALGYLTATAAALIGNDLFIVKSFQKFDLATGPPMVWWTLMVISTYIFLA